MYSEDFIIKLKTIISLPNGYSVLAKHKNHIDTLNKLIEYTSFLDEKTKIKERCEYIFQGLTERKKCKCGCGENVSTIFINFIQNHSHRDPEIKKKWQEARSVTMKERWYDCGKKDEIYKKVKNTNLHRYGVEYTFQTEDVKDKIQKSMLDRYGVDNCSKIDVIKQKKKETYRKNYNCELNCSDEINSKIIKSRHKNTYKRFSRFDKYVIPDFSLDEFIGGGKKYNWICKTCECKFFAEYDDGLIPRCTICYPPQTKFAENEIYDFLNRFGFEIIRNTRKIISPLELDFYIPELNLAIEYNGLYWHQHRSTSNLKYHYNKTLLCKEKGIRLIHIFEDEWILKRNIVQSRLTNIIDSKANTITFARSCKIVEITTRSKNNFLKTNHLQQEDKSTLFYGLENKDGELLAVMTFGKPRFSRKHEYELIRFCTKLGNVVVGGAGRLLNHFKKNHDPESIITYADLRWSDYANNLYDKLGFSYSHTSSPNFWYFKRVERISRYSFQKHKLAKIFNDFDATQTADENIMRNGYSKIYDCGNLVYVWSKT